ncbi:VasL domain-containing protein [Siccibacter colletis]|uniref:VasL domain-containing protein n=1 Tax=Siccibacter colletis TaxID=1505757 RepID=UPI0028BD5FC8|nr:VasL domain-containing protein [Siccibacter colletis]WNN47197.1 VasL domain-containing protein [Siccibacter colletis]
MTTTPTDRHLNTGGDPRTLADYARLREEMNKLTHPARPDVNWLQAEQYCLNLFEHNGIELQTAAWYTLTRTQRSGLAGLNEGLALIEALIVRRWDAFWPQPVHARVEILSALSRRLQQAIRVITPTCYELGPLYQAEQHLTSIGEALQGLELKHASQTDALRTLIHSAAVRLENSGSGPESHAAVAHNGVALPPAVSETHARRVYVAPQQGMPAAKPWKPFAAGMLTMLVMAGLTGWGWQHYHQPDPLLTPLYTALAPRSATLSPEQAATLRQQLKAMALPQEFLDGWYQGMQGLQHLTGQLNSLDERRGKYITVSELKSQVFSITQSFNRAVPAEERLRQLALIPADQPLPPAQSLQTEQHIKQLLARYALLRQRAPDHG